MLIAGIIIASVGTCGIFTAVGMELMTHEAVWMVMMKIAPWFVGLGMALIGWGRKTNIKRKSKLPKM